MTGEISEFKIVVVGESGVGKSSIVSSFCGDVEGEAAQAAGQGATDQRVVTKKTEVQSKEISLKITDTAGSVEKLQKFTKSLYKGAQGIMVVYDVTDKDSFEAVIMWLQDIDEHHHGAPVIVVIGNKCDMEDKRVISKETLEGFAIDHGVSFIEASGTTGVNVKEAFDLITEEILFENQEQSAARRNYCTLL